MNWDRSHTIALAKTACTHCHGYGLRPGRGGQETPCNCVLREIFRLCYSRFRHCVNDDRRMSTAKLEFCTSGKDNRMTYGRKIEEYIADFCLVSRRALSPLQYDIFRFHFLLGADWKLCCWRLNLDRGSFFHAVYKIEQTLGRVYRELEPYGLFPLDEYFANTMHDDRRMVSITPKSKPAHVLRPPLVRTAA